MKKNKLKREKHFDFICEECKKKEENVFYDTKISNGSRCNYLNFVRRFLYVEYHSDIFGIPSNEA